MSAVYDWTVPFTLISPFGTLPLNQPVVFESEQLGIYLLEHKTCESGAEMRVSRDDVPQASGEIQHLHYKTGYEMRIKLGIWQYNGTDQVEFPACDELLQDMGDLLQLHLNALVDDDPVAPLAIVADPAGLCRIHWTPAGSPVDRMLNPIRLLERPIFAVDDETQDLMTVTFALMSDRPFAWDAPAILSCFGGPIPDVGRGEPDIGCSGANPQTLTNAGTSEMWPFVRIYGPFNTFTLVNHSTLDQNGQPLQIVYDASLPGAHSVGSGHFIEIDMWSNTVYFDGNVANYKPGINIPLSDFWFIQPGDNDIEITGGYTGDGMSVSWQNAWA